MKVKTLLDKLRCYNPESEVKILCHYIKGKNGYAIKETDIAFGARGEPLIVIITKEDKINGQ